MLGRKQEINLQLTELVDSALLAFVLWASHLLRSCVLQPLFPNLEVVAPFSELFWVMAIVVPFVLTCALSLKIIRPGYRVA